MNIFQFNFLVPIISLDAFIKEVVSYEFDIIEIEEISDEDNQDYWTPCVWYKVGHREARLSPDIDMEHFIHAMIDLQDICRNRDL